MAAPPTSRLAAKGPELGSFPLDHFRECKTEVEAYYKCLEQHDLVAPMCRDLVREYLRCRMDRGLMTKADVANFGLPETDFVPTRMHKQDAYRDANRGTGLSTMLGPLWEQHFKSEELKKDDGYEAVKGTTTPVGADVLPPRVMLNKERA